MNIVQHIMSTQTIFYIILAGIIALLLALFQYQYKTKGATKRYALFAFLRFLSVFLILILLINPKFETIQVFTEKPQLAVAVDNSSSVAHLNQTENVKALVEEIQVNKELQDKFDLQLFSFGENFKVLDSLSFDEKQSHIDQAFNELTQVFKHTIAPTLLITDGNQTYGNDYEFSLKKHKQNIYPVILGDTLTYIDLKIEQLHLNKYAYLKNRFPVEVILVYNGNAPVSSRFVVKSGNTTVFSQGLSFTKSDNSKVINFTLPASRVGVLSYNARILPDASEKNKINNSKSFAVEVIDQKTNVALISNLMHPDLGALKKSIESNEQRKVSFFKPNEILNTLDDFQLVVLYQPDNSFKALYKALDAQNKNRFVVAGTKTNWRLLNVEAKNYKQDITSQTEDYQGLLNVNYGAFIIEDLNFQSFPPLASAFGEAEFSVPYETLLFKQVNGIETEEPLLASFESNGRREAILFGENLWKWRAQSYMNTKSFSSFDNFTGKLVQYLASDTRKSRLNLDYESFYLGNTNVLVKAQFFNRNYEFDPTENLNIIVKDQDSKETRSFPFLLKNKNYEVDLSSLPASDYSFTVKAGSASISKSGEFKILEYSVEQQFLNANVTKLEQIATHSKGSSYFIADYKGLFDELLQDERYQPIQKNSKKIVPLIDWKYLLFLIALSLAAEWFLRKYNGLI